MKTSNILCCFYRSPQRSDVASEGETQTQALPATPLAAPVQPHLSASASRRHRNFANVPQLRDHPLSSLVRSRAERQIGGDVNIAAQKNSARGIQDFAVDELENMPSNQRLAWLRNAGADKAMQETMRSGSADAIEAWTEIVQLLPETSRFAFLGQKIKPSETDDKDGTGNFFSNLASGVMTMVAPTAVRIRPVGWGLVDHVSGISVPVSEVVQETGGAMVQQVTQSFANHLIGDSAKLFFPKKNDNGDNGASAGKLRPTGKLEFDFSYGSEENKGTDNDHGNSIAASIFSNTQPDAMKAWGKLLALVPDQNRERSKLLLARMDHAAGTPALAILLERGEKQALDQFVGLAGQHVRPGDDDIHRVLFDCLPALNTLTSQRGKVSGSEALNWVRADGLKYTNPHGLSLNSQETAQAYGKLVRLAPDQYRNDIFFPEDIWANFPRKNGDADQLHPSQARELAHSITLLKAMVPTMSAAEREIVLNEIRSHHATKTMGFWKNTSSYEQFKRTWPAVDAMLLDLKAELKKAPSH